MSFHSIIESDFKLFYDRPLCFVYKVATHSALQHVSTEHLSLLMCLQTSWFKYDCAVAFDLDWWRAQIVRQSDAATWLWSATLSLVYWASTLAPPRCMADRLHQCLLKVFLGGTGFLVYLTSAGIFPTKIYIFHDIYICISMDVFRVFIFGQCVCGIFNLSNVNINANCQVRKYIYNTCNNFTF